jgi:NADH:ubiquinone oxidoreductase subunit
MFGLRNIPFSKKARPRTELAEIGQRHSPGNARRLLAFLSSRKFSERTMYPWPTGEFDNVMDDALGIAMDYLDRTGQAVMFKEVQTTAATAIAAAWKGGVRHRIKLANIAVRAVEQNREPTSEPKFAWERR